jgi:hypothetical protein
VLRLPLDLDVERPNVRRLGRDQRHGGPGRARDPRVAGRRCAAPQARRGEEKLDALFMEGLNSGPAEPMTAKDWADIRANLEEHIAKRHGRA